MQAPNAPRSVPRRTSTLVGLLALALLPVVPMPIAGGTPISIALLVLMMVAQLVGRRQTSLDGADQLLIVASVTLLVLESITVLMTNSQADLQYALGRLYWIVLLVVALFFSNAEASRGNSKFLFDVLGLGLGILLAAMLAQSLFYPEYESGRDFGFIQMPFPRATGVPNSDGKIGTFLAVCLTVSLFYGERLKRWRRYFLLFGAIGGLLFTQSRSGLLSFIAIFTLYWTYRCLSDRNLLIVTIRWILVICGVLLLIYYTQAIFSNLVGQGTLERNVVSRGFLASYAMDRIADAPILGSGANALSENALGANIHNTVLAMSLKSGVFAGFLMTLIIVYAAVAFRGNMRFTFFQVALVVGIAIEHSLYPGFINEFLVLAYIAVKWVWRLTSAAPVRQAAPVAAGKQFTRYVYKSA